MKLTGEDRDVSCLIGFSFDPEHEEMGGWVTKLKQLMIMLVALFTVDWIFEWSFKDWRRMHFCNSALILP